MNKTFNINLGGYPFAIDEDAYEYIQNYLGTIRRHFAASDGCEEILYDIEVRMAELFQEHLKGRAIISMKEIDEVIMIMGKPEDFGAEPMAEPISSGRGKKSDYKIKTGKRLFRDPDDKKVGGVCSGIAAYFGIEDPLWVRLIFALLLISGVGAVTYIVLWVLIPEASNAGDKLAMRGEPATIENIAKVVENELTEFGDKINEWSKDLGTKKKSGGEEIHFRAKSVLAGGVNLFGKVVGGIIPTIRTVFKPLFTIAAVVVLSLVGISWAASFIGLTFAAPYIVSMGPSSNFISYLGFGSLFFTIGLPMLGIMLMIARVGFGYKVHKNIKTGFWTMWFLSIFITSFSAMSTVKSYSQMFDINSTTDYNIESNDIIITMPEENLDHAMGVHLGDFFTQKNDQWAIKAVKVKIEKSKDNLVHIVKKIVSRGSNTNEAQENAIFVSNDINVNGNEISISKFLTIPKKNKYRNQNIEYTIYIPEGKTVSFGENTIPQLRESSLLSWNQIYDDLAQNKWVVKASSLYSESWESQHNHKKEINAGKYSKIIVEKGFDIVITKSEQTKVTFGGNKDLVDQVTHKNLDGTLTINTDLDDVSDITIRIETPSLELIHLDGIRTAKIDGFTQDNLKLICNGDRINGNIDFFGSIKNLDVSLSGSQNLHLTGSGELLDIHIDQEASINADKYAVKTANWSGGQNYKSSLHVTESFVAADPENIGVKLLGNPTKIKQ